MLLPMRSQRTDAPLRGILLRSCLSQTAHTVIAAESLLRGAHLYEGRHDFVVADTIVFSLQLEVAKVTIKLLLQAHIRDAYLATRHEWSGLGATDHWTRALFAEQVLLSGLPSHRVVVH